MGGFQLNGCGAKDYFKKMKYLGEQMCPNCQKLSPFYLEKGKFKVSVFWIPTITLKERYAIMCENCKQGRWIEDAEAYQILSGKTYTTGEAVQNETELLGASVPSSDTSDTTKTDTADIVPSSVSTRVCPQCGAQVEGAFCSICGTKYVEPVADGEETFKICVKCGAEVVGAFCSVCGTKYIEPTIDKEETIKICAKCGAEVVGAFCSVCGTKF